MTRSFSSLCITNAICLTSLWILIILGIYGAEMQREQDLYDLLKDGMINEDDKIYYFRILSMETISKSLIGLGFVLDSAVCFTEFMVVWLKVQAPPGIFYFLSVGRYLIYILFDIVLVFVYYDAKYYAWYCITVLVLGALCRIEQAVVMCLVNKKFSNEVDGIIVPVAYAVGPIGKKATAGA